RQAKVPLVTLFGNCTSLVTSQRDECAQPRVTQEKPTPNEHADNHRKEEPWILEPHLGCGGAAQITREQDRAQDGGPRNHKESKADQLSDPNRENQPNGISEANGSFHGGSQPHHLNAAVKEQEQHDQGVDDAS